MNNYVVSLTLQCQPHTPSGDMCILKYLQDLDNPVRGSENEQAWNKEYLYHNVKYIRLSWYVSPMINMKHKHIPWANCSVQGLCLSLLFIFMSVVIIFSWCCVLMSIFTTSLWKHREKMKHFMLCGSYYHKQILKDTNISISW